ncbi:MAG: hypothetical protein ACOYL3_12450 [Desulfuromonadaceae bacterium]
MSATVSKMEIVAELSEKQFAFFAYCFFVQLFSQLIMLPLSRKNCNPFTAVGRVIDVKRFVVKTVPGGIFSGYRNGLVNAVAEVFESWGGRKGFA